jgi:hypothetical protein
MPTTTFTGTNLGGGFTGISAKQTITNFKTSEHAMARRILRGSWNGQYATGASNGVRRAIGPFRAVTNTGDFLSRQNYRCGDLPLANNVDKHCDTTGVPGSSTNVKFVSDSSDYITFKKQSAMNRTYNDISAGGDNSSASYSAFKMHY